MNKWKDTTSYRRGQERIPNAFTLSSGNLKITIVSGHIYYPGKWIMNCYTLGISERELGLDSSVPAKDAKEAALKMVLREIESMKEEAESALDALSQ